MQWRIYISFKPNEFNKLTKITGNWLATLQHTQVWVFFHMTSNILWDTLLYGIGGGEGDTQIRYWRIIFWGPNNNIILALFVKSGERQKVIFCLETFLYLGDLAHLHMPKLTSRQLDTQTRRDSNIHRLTHMLAEGCWQFLPFRNCQPPIQQCVPIYFSAAGN